MPSPFPGMDPYLEQHWGDVHTSLVIYARNQLQKVLPEDLRARVEERVVISGLGRPRSVYPDVQVIQTKGKSRRPAKRTARVAVAEPVVIDLPDEPETQTFVEIRDLSADSRVVTVLEMLSPSNKKPGDAQEQYLRKQLELMHARVSLVEIDLLRQGDWIVALPVGALEPNLRTPYRVVVRRGWRHSQADYYPISLPERLPTIKVPLRPTDADVPLDLQALIDLCYADGGYDDLDYAAGPVPPLPPTLARWATQLLRRAGRRPSRKQKP
jgi:uncharacterized protein DUF4058